MSVRCCEELQNSHPNVEVLFMPTNTTSLIQTRNQGVIKAFKAQYTRERYSNAFESLKANKETTMMDYWKSVTIRHVIMLTPPGTASGKLLSITAGKMFGRTVWKVLTTLKV